MINAYYLNLKHRTDRNEHMQKMLLSHGLNPIRVDAEIVDQSNGFMNKAVRGNWSSHMKMIEMVALSKERSIIFEDDAIITSIDAVNSAMDKIHIFPDWDALYFHGLRSGDRGLRKITTVINMHAYTINPLRYQKLLDTLQKEKTRIEQQKPADYYTYIDQFMAWKVQPVLNFYGTGECVIQDPKFGSDTGWAKCVRN